MGCVPAELAQRSPNGQCSAELQRAASLYNPQLTQMLGQLNDQYGADIFIAANTRQMTADFVYNPQAYGKLVQVNYFYFLKTQQIYWMLALTKIISAYTYFTIKKKKKKDYDGF
jgi:hypothetical protein